MDTIFDLFDESIDFPSKELCENLPPVGTCYVYVGYDYVNKHRQNLIPFYAIMLNRYSKNFQEAKKNLNIRLKEDNVDLTDCNGLDDFILLMEDEHQYYYVWLDFDVSDCVIGVLSKDKYTKVDLIKALTLWLNNWDNIKDRDSLPEKGYIIPIEQLQTGEIYFYNNPNDNN